MRLILPPTIYGIVLGMLLTGCAVTPIRNEGDTTNGTSIVETLGSATVVGDDSGKELASEAMTETVAAAAFSTPELIDAAYASGEIDAGERILYLAYAVYDYEALPAAFQSSTPWRGSMTVAEIKESVASPDFCTFDPEVQEELQQLLADAADFPTCP